MPNQHDQPAPPHGARARQQPQPPPPAAPSETDPAPGFRLHSGPPDYEKYRYGYPPTPGYMFGSGN
jgi:hypothetical protein